MCNRVPRKQGTGSSNDACALIGLRELGPEWFALARRMPYELCDFDIRYGTVAPDVVVPVKAWLLVHEEFIKF